MNNTVDPSDDSPADHSMYQVLLENRRIGPFNRRTIVGMRIRQTLNNEHQLISNDGTGLTVGELIAKRSRRFVGGNASHNRTGGYSVVQAVYIASLYGREGAGFDIPLFQGEAEVRIQADVLRIAGRYRQAMRWKEGRVKLPMRSVVYARATGSRADLWLRPPVEGKAPDAPANANGSSGAPLQALSLELFSPESAQEFLQWLPGAKPAPATLLPAPAASANPMWLVWVVVIGVLTVLACLALVLFFRR